jgi:hypothetical protein
MDNTNNACVILSKREYSELKNRKPIEITKKINFTWLLKITDNNRWYYSFGGDFELGPKLSSKIRRIATIVGDEVFKLSEIYKKSTIEAVEAERNKCRLEFENLSLWEKIIFTA